MKFVVQRDHLTALIGKIQGVVPSKAVIPILSNVLIEASGHTIVITATDLTVSIRATMEGRIQEEGSVTLPARRLFQLIRELTAPEVTIETASEGIANISSGTSRFKLHGMSKEEFPTFPDLSNGKSFSLDSDDLEKMLSGTSFAAAKDDSRQVLNGIFLQIEDGRITMVGTDGKRLAKLQRKIDLDDSEKQSCIVPLKAVEEMIRMLSEDEKATVTLMPDKIAMESGTICLVSKLLTGQFPDYERVIPDRTNMQDITLHKDELISLLKQVSLFTSDLNHSVKLTFEKGELKLAATNSDIGEGKVNMPVDYNKEKLDIAFNPHYFIDILRHCQDETVSFGVTDSFNPGSITDSSQALYVLMPMRLNSE